MPDPKCCVLVVGGGPAGSSCAWKLSSAGVRCMLIDKAEFPRDKVCGGALSSRAAGLLINSGIISTAELDRLTEKTHRTLVLWNREELLRSYTSDNLPVRIISRMSFDNFLLEKAANSGAEVITGETAVSIDSSFVRTSSDRSIRYSFLVGADGCSSFVRKTCFGRSGRKTGIGLECFLPLSEIDNITDGLHIHFRYLPYGYVWAFPGREKICIGAGVVGSKASPSDVNSALKEFLETRGISVSKYVMKAASIPSLSLHKSMGAGQIFLAGDAAGLVDQVSGEGIGHAIESGLLIADAIISGGDKKTMLIKANEGCLGTVRQSEFYRHLLFSRLTEKLAMSKLKESETFARAYWSLISGSQSYNEMFRRLLTRSG
ncbi:MAG: geranylgeranyl reductase family protein [Candidatus Aegiribacteria sp.]|nr:geranylgeranyl reductase family protein [Candidatus Aegiribacteria sp.]